MKKLFTLAMLIYGHIGHAQTWSAMGNGLTGTTVFPRVFSLAVYNGELYAGGTFTMAGGTPANCIARWDGSTWDSCGSGTSGSTGSMVTTMAAYNGALYVGGDFTMAGGTTANHVASWNGTTWSGVGLGISAGSWGMAEYIGALVAGGNFDMAGGATVTRGLAQWNGTSWSSLGSLGIDSGNHLIFCFLDYNNELYVGGAFDSIGGIATKGIAKWDGTTWTALGTGLDGGLTGPSVRDIAVYNGEIYVSGVFTFAGGIPAMNIARWNGTSWNACGPGLAAQGVALCVYGGELYAGGGTAVTGSNLAKWNGMSWAGVGAVSGGLVQQMLVYNGDLIVAGSITSAGGISVNKIARFNIPTGTEDHDLLYAVQIFPNPATGKIRVVSPVAMQRIEIMDATGREVSTKYPDGANETGFEIGNAGVYFVRLVSGKGTAVRKIVITD